MLKLSLNVQSSLNIIGSIVVVIINVAINFLLSPYIVKHIGIEANGYITLANNFISYIALVTTALNSMAGRFILIDYRKGNSQSANEYYSSVLLGDWILAGIFFVPMIFFIIFIDYVIKVTDESLFDTQILFAIIFFNYVVNLCLPQWRTATYCTNNLYLRSISNASAAIVRALFIFLLFYFFKPHSYFIAIAACIMSSVGLFLDYAFYRLLMPSLQWKISFFRLKKVYELVSSGIWNTISQCGNILLEGLDILIANIFINPVMSGMLALSKVIPNMITQITGSIATTYGPRLMYLYADNDQKGIIREIKNDMFYISLIANIPIAVFISYGDSFFQLWVPSQNAQQLYWLSCCSLLGMIFIGTSQCIVNIFAMVNKLKLNSLVVILSGLVNILIIYLVLKYTDLGVYSIVLVSSTVSILRILCFTLPYGAHCIEAPLGVFVLPYLKSISNIVMPIGIGIFFSNLYSVNNWWNLILMIAVTCLLSIVIEYFLVLNYEQRKIILQLLHIKR